MDVKQQGIPDAFRCAETMLMEAYDLGVSSCIVSRAEETFDNEAAVRRMVGRQKNMRIPSELLPVCPHCGRPMTMNLRSDDKFVEDKGWHEAAKHYENFLRTRKGPRILFLELGVGYNTPVIIKYPFWRLTAQNPKATYVCINHGEAVCTKEIERQPVCINKDTGKTLSRLGGEDHGGGCRARWGETLGC